MTGRSTTFDNYSAERDYSREQSGIAEQSSHRQHARRHARIHRRPLLRIGDGVRQRRDSSLLLQTSPESCRLQV
jgi:hypothetical protein